MKHYIITAHKHTNRYTVITAKKKKKYNTFYTVVNKTIKDLSILKYDTM